MTGDRERKAAETEAAYDAVANDYAARTSVRSSDTERFITIFLASLPDQSLVLDLGCGPGHDVRHLAGLGHRPVGLDRSADLLGLAGPFPRVRGDLRFLPFAMGSVDGIWSYASLLHIDPAALSATVTDWERVLRPGGIVGLSTSLGGDSGWELAPASASRLPEMGNGARRWFVHHGEDDLLDTMRSKRWDLLDVSVRSSHRGWIQVVARTPIPS